MNKEFLTIDEMAKVLRVSVKTFRKVVKEKSVPFIRVGKQMRFDEEKVLECLTTVEKPLEVPPVHKGGKVPAPTGERWTAADRKLAERLGVKL